MEMIMSMTMFLKSRFNFSNAEAVSYKHFIYMKKRALFTKFPHAPKNYTEVSTHKN